jgi:hypothetical protein
VKAIDSSSATSSTKEKTNMTSSTKRVRSKLSKGFAALTVAVAILAVSAASALASHTHNNNYSYSEMRDAPGGMVIANLDNDTDVAMVCYTDGPYDGGNYTSNRWFYVYAGSTGGWVHSSYVQDQAGVPACG